MNIRQLIRESISTQISLIEEDKTRLVMMIPDKQVSPEQKKEILDHFKQFPHKGHMLENKWNHPERLTWRDFEPILNRVSKSQKKKNVKISGIGGLVKGKDYLEITDVDFNFDYYNTYESTFVAAYLPLDYEASKLLASNKIGVCEGQWCTAYQKSDDYWKSYVYKSGDVLVYVMYDNTKYAVLIKRADKLEPYDIDYTIFDADDDEVKHLPGISTAKFLNDNIDMLKKARSIIKESTPLDVKYGFSGQKYTIEKDGSISVSGDVRIEKRMLVDGKIPIKFNSCITFMCGNLPELISLENSPNTCMTLYAHSTGITSLDGIGRVRNLNITETPVRNLDGLQKEHLNYLKVAETRNLDKISGTFKILSVLDCTHSGIKSIEIDAPLLTRLSCDRCFSLTSVSKLSNNMQFIFLNESAITSLDGLPEEMAVNIGMELGDVDIGGCDSLKSLKGLPKTIHTLALTGWKQKELTGLNPDTVIERNLYLTGSNIENLDSFAGLTINGSLILIDCPNINIDKYITDEQWKKSNDHIGVGLKKYLRSIGCNVKIHVDYE